MTRVVGCRLDSQAIEEFEKACVNMGLTKSQGLRKAIDLLLAEMTRHNGVNAAYDAFPEDRANHRGI